jgi:hypothetical protein
MAQLNTGSKHISGFESQSLPDAHNVLGEALSIQDRLGDLAAQLLAGVFSSSGYRGLQRSETCSGADDELP